MRALLLYGDGIVLDQVRVRYLDERLLYVLDDCNRVVVVQRVDDAQVVALWRVLRRSADLQPPGFRVVHVSDLVHLEVVPLENAQCMKSLLEEVDLLLLDRDVVCALQRRQEALVAHLR